MKEKKAGTDGPKAATSASATRKRGTWSEAAVRVLRERYLLRDAEGTVVETPDELCWRVARAVAAAEARWAKDDPEAVERSAAQFYDLMVERTFLPNSPTLMNAGKGNNLQLSACYVVPVEDSLPGIFDAVKHAALIHQSGGGTGFSFSRLRPEGSTVASTHGVASGPVSFMKIFDGATEAVKQGGCVIPETRVSTDRGMVRIGTMGPLEAKPQSWHALTRTTMVYTDDGGRRAEEFYHHGRAAVRRIRTSCGYALTGTLEHRIRVIDERGAYVWRHLKDLRVGDWVALQQETYPTSTDYRLTGAERVPHVNARETRVSERPTAELGEFIGYLIGSGGPHASHPDDGTGSLTLTVADSEPEVRERLLLLASRLFGITPISRQNPDAASTDSIFHAPELVAWLAHLGVGPSATPAPRLPEIVFSAGAEFARGVVRGMFTADRSLSQEGYPSLRGRSRALIEDMQQVLLALGMPSALSVSAAPDHAEHTAEPLPRYQLRLMTRDGRREFAARIGFMSATKNARLEAGLEQVEESTDIIPNQQERLAELYASWEQSGGPNRGARDADTEFARDLQPYLPRNAAPRPLTRAHLRALAERHEAVRNSPLAAFLTNRQFYDQIVSLADDEALTVDLAVEEQHTYIANGFVSHNSRRGANMGILRVDHPDILKFIDCKRDGSVTNFNISVAITDEFMRALDTDDAYDVVDPHRHQAVTRLRARDVMDRIVAAAWATGDPGLVFIDRANRSTANPTPEIEQLEATNPCVVGATRLATDRGLPRMDTLYASQDAIRVTVDARSLVKTVNGREQVLGGTRAYPAVPVFQTGIVAPVRRLTTSHGLEITATPNHRFLTTRGYKRLDALEYGDEILLQSAEGAWSSQRTLPARALGAPLTEWSEELGEVLGYVVGNGYVRHGASADSLRIAVARTDVALKETLCARIAGWFGAQGTIRERQGHFQMRSTGPVATFCWELGVATLRAHARRVPECIFTAPRDAVVGFLRGLFSANASVHVSEAKGTCHIRLATSSKGLARDTQQLLLNMGIVSTLRLRRNQGIQNQGIQMLPNAHPTPAADRTHAQYELLIEHANRDRFAAEIGFMQVEQQRQLTQWSETKHHPTNREGFTTRVAMIEDAGTATVYDTTEPITHSLIVDGLVTHNCGEQWLGPYDACNLGSINLGLFVRDGAIQWGALEATTRICARFLDDVIDINPFPLPEVREKVYANRRIGLGIMGWAELLFELGLRYDSEEAIALGERVMTQIRDWAADESRQLAEVRGPFPNWSRSIYKGAAPRRNATCTTVAPTGSISILAECSSGIEPVFALAFQHRVKQPDGSYRVLDFVNPFFKRALEASDIADKEAVLAYVREHGSLHGHPAAEHPALRPYGTAHEIAPEWHIRMQAAFQQGVDNSISKTINLPNSATYEDVRQAYVLAWELGCLGITIFRDGCKGEQVLNAGVKAAQPTAAAAPAPPGDAPALPARKPNYINGIKTRPEVVAGYTRQVRAPEGKVNVTLNSDADGLLELFVNIGKAGSDVAALAEALGRLISLHLRMDTPVSQNERAAEVARQLRSIGGSSQVGFGIDRVRSLPDAVARSIELHLATESRGGADVPVLPPAVAAQDDARATSDHGDGPSNGGGHGGGGGLSNGSGAHVLNPRLLASYAVTGNLCTQCGNNTMYYEEGCKKCVSCGYSEC